MGIRFGIKFELPSVSEFGKGLDLWANKDAMFIGAILPTRINKHATAGNL
jgi:hypothetical protein